jgi:uracil-DNA glycosylase family 4
MSKYHHGLIYNPVCDACPLRGCRQVPPDGKVPNNLIFVGEGPGKDEEKEGRNFVGPTGKLLWYMCQSMGIPAREEIWITNTTLCRPRAVRLSNGAEINKEECKWLAAKHCHSRLVWELQYVMNGNPNAVIVPIGKVALWACTTVMKPKIGSYRGAIIEQDWNEILEKNQAVLREHRLQKGFTSFLQKHKGK